MIAKILLLLVSLAPADSHTNHPTIREMLAQNNAIRQNKLELSEELTNAAQDHANYMASHHSMSHYVNGSPTGRARKYGWTGGGVRENIAMSQPSIRSVMSTWRNSSGHYSNMMSASRKCGFGCAISANGTYYWCAIYGNDLQ